VPDLSRPFVLHRSHAQEGCGLFPRHPECLLENENIDQILPELLVSNESLLRRFSSTTILAECVRVVVKHKVRRFPLDSTKDFGCIVVIFQ
jgi:hypothetical protein